METTLKMIPYKELKKITKEISEIAKFVEEKLLEDGYTSKNVGMAWFRIRRSREPLCKLYPEFYDAMQKHIDEYYQIHNEKTGYKYTPEDIFVEVTLN